MLEVILSTDSKGKSFANSYASLDSGVIGLSDIRSLVTLLVIHVECMLIVDQASFPVTSHTPPTV